LEYRPHGNISSIAWIKPLKAYPVCAQLQTISLFWVKETLEEEVVKDHDKKLLTLLERCREKEVK